MCIQSKQFQVGIAKQKSSFKNKRKNVSKCRDLDVVFLSWFLKNIISLKKKLQINLKYLTRKMQCICFFPTSINLIMGNYFLETSINSLLSLTSVTSRKNKNFQVNSSNFWALHILSCRQKSFIKLLPN